MVTLSQMGVTSDGLGILSPLRKHEKILVTGAAGFIGYHTMLKLSEMGYDVVGADRQDDFHQHPIYLHRRQLLTQKNLRLVHLDIRDASNCMSVVGDGYDAVIHLASKPGIRYSAMYPSEVLNVNVVGTQNIFDACGQHDVRTVLYASSSSVYGSLPQTPWCENLWLGDVLSTYAASKQTNEQQGAIYNKTTGRTTLGMRFFTVYGPLGRPDMAVWKFTAALLAEDKISLFGDGTQRDLTYIDDVVRSISLLLDSAPIGKHTTVNVCNAQPVFVEDIITTLATRLDKAPNIWKFPLPDTDAPLTFGNNDLLLSLTGYKPNTPAQLGLERFADWYKENGCQ